MIDFETLTADTICSDEVINEIMDEADPVTRERLKFSLEDRAAQIGEKYEKRVKVILKAAEKDLKEKLKGSSKSDIDGEFDRMTDFGGSYEPLKCGKWKADKNGIYDPNQVPDKRTACRHPILPIEIITNVESGLKKTKIAFCRKHRWYEHIVPNSMLAEKGKITKLADLDVDVNSETAKNLVCFLSDVKNLNYEEIPEVRATAKMGWCEDGFMPYTSKLTFDTDSKLENMFSALTHSGDRDTWFNFVKDVRNKGRIEPRAMMAASFASVLLKPCGLLPFWFELWGKTGNGKSLSMLLAASIWGEPEKDKLIGGFESSVAAFEAKAGFLNHLPFFIDDTATVKEKIKDNFSYLIYRLASGEGKDRSNTSLGLAPKVTWYNVIITTGETPIINDQLQGGAMNRVLEYEVDDGNLFDGEGPVIAALLKNNYGFAGKEFVDVLSELGFDRIADMQRSIFKEIKTEAYEDKQLLSLSALLTADRIATDYIFKDNIYLTFKDLERCLVDANTMNENQRCYEYVMNECAINNSKFVPGDFGYQGEIWGKYKLVRDNSGFDVEYICIQTNIFRKLCASGGFSEKAFISWAAKKNLILKDGQGKNTTVERIAKTRARCICIKCPESVTEFEKNDEESVI